MQIFAHLISNKMRHRPRPLTLTGGGKNKETLFVIGADYSKLEIVGDKNPIVKGHSDGGFAWIMPRKLRI